MIKDFFEEFWDEISDFFEDFIEFFFRIKDVRKHQPKEINVQGHLMNVKPAYLFAERLDNLLKVVFGISIVFSAFTSTFVGFIKLSDLLEILISNPVGRLVMIIIGLSYFLLGFWKIINIDRK